MKTQVKKQQATVKDLKALVESADKFGINLTAAALKKAIKGVK